ncbi:uncharacterized protein LOC131242250 [Magnolia sinica]|uniref:uncharacterized protein LOC131242250 n=1 Tax=Magnolia sinica TaxID=86752 RepID=UPI002657BEAF|nr:uncharacterized protein LOC131242250 [Magnolia sinica]
MVDGYDNTNNDDRINNSNSKNTTKKKKKKKKNKKKDRNLNSSSNNNNNNDNNSCCCKSSSNNEMMNNASVEQCMAAQSVYDWVFPDSSSFSPSVNDCEVEPKRNRFSDDSLVFELHSHSIFSDGFLPPSVVVERAHRNGVKVLALTDHDTMAGIPEALKAANTFGMRIIPGVEISTIFSPGGGSGTVEPVHILAYYGSFGPARFEELENCLANIREGRYLRAKDMISKLNNLKMPLKWEHITKIAGNGVAPGRLHVARAMVEAGHVENLKQAFARYLYDGGPAYAKGREPLAEEAVQLICRTGGVAALAHPWALKNPIAVVKGLKAAGLHAMEVYRSDGKLAGFSDLADAYKLVKLGGSDYHGKGGREESALGSVNLPILVVHEFLNVARPIWCHAMKDILQNFAKEPSDSNLEKIMRFVKIKIPNVADTTSSYGKDVINQCLSSCLTTEEMQDVEFEALSLKLSHTSISEGGFKVSVISG